MWVLTASKPLPSTHPLLPITFIAYVPDKQSDQKLVSRPLLFLPSRFFVFSFLLPTSFLPPVPLKNVHYKHNGTLTKLSPMKQTILEKIIESWRLPLECSHFSSHPLLLIKVWLMTRLLASWWDWWLWSGLCIFSVFFYAYCCMYTIFSLLKERMVTRFNSVWIILSFLIWKAWGNKVKNHKMGRNINHLIFENITLCFAYLLELVCP